MPIETEVDRQFAEAVGVRTLRDSFPALNTYLGGSASILDVGCGPGSITADVAQAATQSIVFGIDPVEYHIQLASKKRADAGCTNLHFGVAHGEHLPFPDDSFDLVYSHTVLHYFVNPRLALAEQKRVTSPGGRIVAAGVRDWGLVRRHPDTPLWDEVVDRRRRYFETAPEARKAHDKSFGYSRAGRECPAWFAEAGLKDIEVSVQPCYVRCPAACPREPLTQEPNPMDLLPWEHDDAVGYHRYYRQEYETMVSAGAVTRQDVHDAMVEARTWYRNPAAFHFYFTVCVTGLV